MKLSNYLFTLILVMFYNSSHSQNYQSIFGSDSTTWDIATIYCDAGGTRTATIVGDTIINSNGYKIIREFPVYLREDTLQGKVWFYNSYDSTEYLTMNLDLSLGDTFDIHSYLNTPFHHYVDSVYFLNNLKHVRLNTFITMCGDVEKITFIEGVGSTAGLFFQGNNDGSNVQDYMLCQHKNGVKVASNLIYPDTCFIQVISVSEYSFNDKNLIVYPNPSYNELNIKLKNTINTGSNFAIYNLLGTKVISGSISDNRYKIDISKLANGVYIILVEENKTLKSTKFLKQ